MHMHRRCRDSTVESEFIQYRGRLQLPRRAPAAPWGRPSWADLALLRPSMSALGDALAAQEEGLDRRS